MATASETYRDTHPHDRGADGPSATGPARMGAAGAMPAPGKTVKLALAQNGDSVSRSSSVPVSAGSDPEILLPQDSWYLLAKVGLDRVFAFLILVAMSPLILLAMVLIKLTSRGPALYSQTRVGRLGRPFTIYKLRSMVVESESLTGATWSTPGDARVTSVGRWLRRSHIDELPQLWNVLRGDMSLVGPRPERPEFVPMLEKAIPYYRDRLLVRPGITGFAQVQLPPDTDINSVRIKLAYDLHYVQALSFGFDLRIYWATAFKMVGTPFSVLCRLFRFPERVMVESRYEHLAIEAQRLKKALKNGAGRTDGVTPIPLMP